MMDYGAEKMTERNNSLKRNEEANQLTIHGDRRGVKLRITEKKPFSGQGGLQAVQLGSDRATILFLYKALV